MRARGVEVATTAGVRLRTRFASPACAFSSMTSPRMVLLRVGLLWRTATAVPVGECFPLLEKTGKRREAASLMGGSALTGSLACNRQPLGRRPPRCSAPTFSTFILAKAARRQWHQSCSPWRLAYRGLRAAAESRHRAAHQRSVSLAWLYERPILVHMKQVIVELDDEMMKRLAKVAPPRSRRRSEFIRNALRKALWELEERQTRAAYSREPDSDEPAYFNPDAWEK